MSKHKNKTPATHAPETPETMETTQELAKGPAPVAKPESVVDEVFDVVTAWAAKGLVAAKRGLETSARWLDERAKLVGELANKLASTSRSHAPPTNEAHAGQATQSAQGA